MGFTERGGVSRPELSASDWAVMADPSAPLIEGLCIISTTAEVPLVLGTTRGRERNALEI